MTRNNRNNVDDTLERQQRIGFKKYLEEMRQEENAQLDFEDEDSNGWYDDGDIERIAMEDIAMDGGNRTITIGNFTVLIKESEWEKINALMPTDETFIEGTGQGDVYVTRDEDDYAIIESAVGEFAGKIDFITLVNLLDE